MSWISDLAGKAEGLLNQLDQGTAEALVKHGSPSRSARSNTSRSRHEMQPELLSVVSETASLPPPTSSRLTNERRERSSGYASSVSSQISRTAGRVAQQDDDHRLLAYLNETDDTQEGVLSIGSRSRKSSTSSIQSLPKHVLQSQPPQPTNVIVQQTTAKQQVSEQPRPMSTAYTFTSTNQRSEHEQKAQEKDLSKALQAKDTQLAVLKVQLQEAQQLLTQQTQTAKHVQSERDRLVRDSSESSEVRNQAISSLQSQLNEAQQALSRERERAQQQHTEALAKSERIENDMINLNRTLSECQKSLTEEKLRAKEIDSQLRLAKYNLEANKNEFDDYKSKAQKILQSKEKIIESLKFGSRGGGAGEEGSALDHDHTQLAVQLEECRADKDMLNEDLQQLHVQLNNARAELHDLETQSAQEQRESVQTQRSLQEQCQNYQLNAAQYREQLEHLKQVGHATQEYQYVQDELRRQHSEVHTKLQEKDAEIARLLQQLAARQLHSHSDNDLEQRVKQLTDNLIYKQTSIETLQTENNSLQLQLERTQGLYDEAQSAAIKATSTSVFIGTDEASSNGSGRIPAVLRVSPYDSAVISSAKQAYATVDRFCAKMLYTLRRYPLAGVMMLFYMVLLHCWVMVVLLTYTPEIHTGQNMGMLTAQNDRALAQANGAHPLSPN